MVHTLQRAKASRYTQLIKPSLPQTHIRISSPCDHEDNITIQSPRSHGHVPRCGTQAWLHFQQFAHATAHVEAEYHEMNTGADGCHMSRSRALWCGLCMASTKAFLKPGECSYRDGGNVWIHPSRIRCVALVLLPFSHCRCAVVWFSSTQVSDSATKEYTPLVHFAKREQGRMKVWWVAYSRNRRCKHDPYPNRSPKSSRVTYLQTGYFGYRCSQKALVSRFPAGSLDSKQASPAYGSRRYKFPLRATPIVSMSQ